MGKNNKAKAKPVVVVPAPVAEPVIDDPKEEKPEIIQTP
jgi:hypothetical protein